jgi:hypothetical protein
MCRWHMPAMEARQPISELTPVYAVLGDLRPAGVNQMQLCGGTVVAH